MPREHRPAPILVAPGDLDGVVARFEQRHEVDVLTLQQEVCADQRGASCGIFVTNLRKVDVRNPHPELGVPIVGKWCSLPPARAAAPVGLPAIAWIPPYVAQVPAATIAVAFGANRSSHLLVVIALTASAVGIVAILSGGRETGAPSVAGADPSAHLRNA